MKVLLRKALLSGLVGVLIMIGLGDSSPRHKLLQDFM